MIIKIFFLKIDRVIEESEDLSLLEIAKKHNIDLSKVLIDYDGTKIVILPFAVEDRYVNIKELLNALKKSSENINEIIKDINKLARELKKKVGQLKDVLSLY